MVETWASKRFLKTATALVVLIISGVVLYGYHTVTQARYDQTIRVGLVQPNISLKENWDYSLKSAIVDKTLKLTNQLKDDKLDLILWPEASLPGLITDDFESIYKIRLTAKTLNTSLLIGSTAQEGDQFFNSAFLIGADGQMRGRYDKIHLVPFGEYLPLRPILGWINHFVPLDDFTSGRTYKIFSLTPKIHFGTLICFEDTLGDMCRQFALKGADFFVNITNDAWFKNTREPFLHLQGAVFGCVENHRALAHAANTGVSALVDPVGRITMTIDDGHGQKLFIAASSWGILPLNHQMTFYTKYGDIFTIFCFLCILIASSLW
jgi:apolipoprotein N-acyltransferase